MIEGIVLVEFLSTKFGRREVFVVSLSSSQSQKDGFEFDYQIIEEYEIIEERNPYKAKQQEATRKYQHCSMYLWDLCNISNTMCIPTMDI